MLTIMFLIVLGIILGYAFKKQEFIFKISNLISAISVYLLLFFMGISTAVKQDLFSQFREIGAISIILCFSGILGSVLALIPIGIHLKRNRSFLWSFLELRTNNLSEHTTERNENLQISSNRHEHKQQNTITRDMFYPIIFFVLGFFFSMLIVPEKKDWMDATVTYSLYLLIFFTGIGIGRQNTLDLIKKYHIFVLIIPLVAMLGSMLMGFLVSLLIKGINTEYAVAISSGMGYYSISAIITSQNLGEIVGVMALFTNLLRELITMLFAPLMVKWFGPLAPIGSGGATAMDTTLPFIKKSSGNEYAIIGFISGVILTILVPIVTAIFN